MSTLPGQAQCQLGLTFYRGEIPIRCAAPATAPRSPETRRLHNHRPAAAREAARTCTHRAEAGPGVLGLNVQSMYAETLRIHITLTYIILKLQLSFSRNFDVFHGFMIQISMTTTG